MSMKTRVTKCSVAGCDKRVYIVKRRLCRSHYDQQKREDPSRPKCKFDGCEKRSVTNGVCSSHYTTQRIKQFESDTSRPKCKIDGCEKRAAKKGTCIPHYRQQELENTKDKLYEILGGKKCVMCGYSDERALTFDHIYDDGYLDRADNDSSGGKTKLLKYVNTPLLAKERLQVLCFNCNLIKERERVKTKRRK